ncbi:hypothetical protein DPMN_125184 [Dreissena polymorpha]|uniref:Uncharacterized protein n=1 Tax=Dreissena polymorpha TaxID=45954 RepID=A0A9D4JSV9_DREPO|nr:hypothetical protein DPMN_125184 [Dreissena polymorpha]
MGGAPWHAVAHNVPEASTTELDDIVQVYRKVRYSTLSVPCCWGALHHILSWKCGRFTLWKPDLK